MRTLIYTIKQGFSQIFRNGPMSVASVFSITAMLLILGVFFVLVVNINMLTDSVRSDYDTIEVFMDEESDTTQVKEIMNSMKAEEGVSSVTYRSKEEALKILQDSWGDQGYLLEDLEENPLPDSVVIQIDDIQKAKDIAAKAQTFNGIEQVNYYKDTVEKIMKVTDFIELAAIVIMIFLIIVSIVVVANTVKLTVFARGDEIGIMKYVGATNWFVRGPFLVEGVVIGFFSAAVAIAAMGFAYSKLVAGIGEDMMIMLSTPMVPVEFFIQNIIIIFISLGVSIGACGSIISMRRFLDV